MKKKLFSSLIAVILVLSMSVGCFAACSDTSKTGDTSTNVTASAGGSGEQKASDSTVDTASAGTSENQSASTSTEDPTPVELTDDDVYNAALGEYNELLTEALAKTDLSERFAAMAIAEAKLLESATFLPTTSQGGRFAIGKVAPYTVSPTLWGTDSDRLYSAVLATENIKTVDRDALKAIYAEVKGTGTYLARAKEYLTGKGYTLKDTYNMAYSEDPSTWDITNTYRSVDSEAIVNTYDGLIQYDVEGKMQPALAREWNISEDGLKYTFTIREGVYWVNQDGEEYQEITAQDFVDGMQTVMDNGQTSYLVDGIIKGSSAYIAGDETDFETVGVKALDDYVLEYELEAPCPYFMTMMNYNPFAPICKAYVDETEDYGSAPDKILYCGPYTVTNYTPNNKIVFSANDKYWNKDAVNVKTLTWVSYAENEDVTATYKDMKAGTIDGASLNTTTISTARQDGYNDYIYVSGTDATTYGFFFNINRKAYATDGITDATSAQTDAQKAVTAAAMKLADFRMAFARGLDRVAYNAIAVGEECALYSLQNSYTPGTYVTLSKAVTVKIGEEDVTFEAGTNYGEIVQAQLDADMGEKAMKVWDPEADGGIGSSSGFDGWYNKDIAKEYLNKAIATLAEQGINVSADNPIHIDYPVWSSYATFKNRAEALKQKVAEVFEGKVVLDIVGTSQKGWYYVGYYAESGEECNYDIYDCSGWGPDFGDPSTYLNTMKPVNGDMIKMLGIY